MLYKFKLRGHLDNKWYSWLLIKSILNENDGISCFLSEIEDQSALFSLIRRIRDLGLPLLSISIYEEKEASNEN